MGVGGALEKPIKERGDNYVKGFSKDAVFHNQIL
jgi:hypothetical protein